MIGEDELEKFFHPSKDENEEASKNIITLNKKNKFDDYFEMTEKISTNSKYIQDFKNGEKLIGRKYLDKDNNIKYIEIFKNKKYDILGISQNITFLHLYEPNEDKKYNENKFIGFRYYENGPNHPNSKYFTLINRYDSKYYILEKNIIIKDINGELFFDKEIDCFSIIQKIITEKYKNINNSIFGETFPEIIGYCYGLKSLNKAKNFNFIEPLIPEPFKPETLIEDISTTLKDNITYVEPVIYNGHISLILFTVRENKRYNIILDMSRYHSNTTHLNKLIFPKSIINKAFVYPEKPIQKFSSCCLWFFGVIECLLQNNKYLSLESIYDNISDGGRVFYIDVINIIGKNYYGIDEIFKKVKERSREINNIDLNRLFINGKEKYIIDKNIAVTRFLDLNSFLYNSSFFYFSRETNVITNTQKILEVFINFKNLLEINLKFYEILELTNEDKKIISAISDEIIYIENILTDILNNYNIEFIRKNIFSYEMFLFNDIMKGKSIVFPLSEEMQKKLEEMNYDLLLKDRISEFNKRKKSIEGKCNIYSVEDIIKQLNPNNNICFKIMNK